LRAGGEWGKGGRGGRRVTPRRRQQRQGRCAGSRALGPEESYSLASVLRDERRSRLGQARARGSRRAGGPSARPPPPPPPPGLPTAAAHKAIARNRSPPHSQPLRVVNLITLSIRAPSGPGPKQSARARACRSTTRRTSLFPGSRKKSIPCSRLGAPWRPLRARMDAHKAGARCL
jgi:hypothetical protein